MKCPSSCNSPVFVALYDVHLQACERLGACSKKEEVFKLLQQRPVGDDVTCPICEYIVIYIKEQLEDPETEEQLVQQATQVGTSLLPFPFHRAHSRLSSISLTNWAAAPRSHVAQL